MDETLLDVLAQLRHDSLARSPAYPGGPAALAWHRDLLERALRQGALEIEVSGQELLAFAALWAEAPPYGEREVPHLMLHRQDSPEAAEAARRCADRLLGGQPPDVRCMLPLWDADSRDWLMGRGFGLASVNLAGRAARAREGLGAPTPLPPGVEVRPLEPEDVDGVLCLHAAVFGEEPLYAPFAAQPGFLEKYRRVLHEPDSPHARWVLTERGALVGYLSARFNLEDPHHGSSAGVDLVLDRRARGRGLARALYAVVLETMEDRGAAWLKGTTARPQVLRLAGVMGRRITTVNLSQRDSFPVGWFDMWLSELK